jgi:hypothetical protein
LSFCQGSFSPFLWLWCTGTFWFFMQAPPLFCFPEEWLQHITHALVMMARWHSQHSCP